MKKEILAKFASFKVSRNISKEIKGGYPTTGQCNGVGCPSSGGYCTYHGPCSFNGSTYGVYTCQTRTPVPPGCDSIPCIYPTYTYTECTGAQVA